MDIVRKLSGDSGFPFLKMVPTLLILRMSGNFPVEKHMFIRLDSGVVIISMVLSKIFIFLSWTSKLLLLFNDPTTV